MVRSLSIDELPQLINVLKGDMSLVGPRPLLVQYLPLYSDRQARRHEVKPGMTVWAGVVLVTLSFNVKNVGSEPYTFTEEHIALFDAKEKWRNLLIKSLGTHMNMPILMKWQRSSNGTTRSRSHLFSHVAGLLKVGHGTSALWKNSALAK